MLRLKVSGVRRYSNSAKKSRTDLVYCASATAAMASTQRRIISAASAWVMSPLAASSKMAAMTGSRSLSLTSVGSRFFILERGCASTMRVAATRRAMAAIWSFTLASGFTARDKLLEVLRASALTDSLTDSELTDS